MNIYKSIGMVAGILIGIIICFFIFKYGNTNRKPKTVYDERQNEIRGKGYRVAFYAAMILEAVMTVLYIGNLPLPFEPYMAHGAVIFLSCTVLGCYLIWNGAYWGLNNDRKRYYIILCALVVLNAVPFITAAAHGSLFENGKMSSVWINLLGCVMLIVFWVLMMVRNYLDRKAGEE